MDFVFVSRTPAAPLARYVESVWYARGQIGYPRERIAPTGSTVAGIVLGAPIRQTPNDGHADTFVADTGFLIGPHDRPVINEPTAETYCLGIVTTPVGCRAVFGVDPGPLRGRVVDLVSVWPQAATLRADVAAGSAPEQLLDLVQATLVAGLRMSVTGLDRCEAAVAALVADPTRSIAELAGQLGVSHGHLDREFTRIVGLTPRTLARTLRLRRMLDHLDVYGEVAWTALAAELGWFDQAHLIRDFKRHTGVAPSHYVAAQRQFLVPEQATPGFVPGSPR